MNRCRRIFVPPVVLDRLSATPLHRQIRDQIARAIVAGTVGGESRLPSTRTMARILQVSRNTIMAAFDSLAADGLVRGVPGSGMRVNAPFSAPFSPRQLLRAAHYPACSLALQDPDGNPLAINF